jgi:2-keto-4-pentenoate hydratase/2-oxohepta-3-ene-1,7-dioic acid hydratase in catechol pathway
MDKIICVGKNYLKHALELGDAVPEEPTYFIKPPSTIFTVSKNGEVVRLPHRGEIHHEVELVFRLQKNGDDQLKLSHFTFGVDMTIRDLQARLKKAGQPWEKAKVFQNSAILGPWRENLSLKETMQIPFSLSVNGEVRQKGLGQDMRWTPDFLLNDLPKWFPIKDGDLLFTGTPEGVGPLKDGDLVEINGGNITYAFQIGTRLV